MGVFQTLSAGNIGQLGAPGNGVPAEASNWRADRRQAESNSSGGHAHARQSASIVFIGVPPPFSTVPLHPVAVPGMAEQRCLRGDPTP